MRVKVRYLGDYCVQSSKTNIDLLHTLTINRYKLIILYFKFLSHKIKHTIYFLNQCVVEWNYVFGRNYFEANDLRF